LIFTQLSKPRNDENFSVHHLERQPHRPELRRLLAPQLRPDLLEPPDRFPRLEPLTTAEADLGPHLQYGGVGAAPKELLQLPALFAAMELCTMQILSRETSIAVFGRFWG